MSDLKPLNRKQKRVLDEYLICFVQWKAYKAAYPDSSDEVCRTSSSRLFADANFQGHLQERLNEVHMAADEALKLTADIARGDITEFLTPYGNLDIDLLKTSGKGRLVKKIKQKTVTKIGKGDKDEDTEVVDTEIELYPADAALDKILKIHGKYSDAPTVNINMSWKDFVDSANPSPSDK
jgi:phage terminase small subunit